MKLFIIDENNAVKVNSPWVKLIPEFARLFYAAGKNRIITPLDRNDYARRQLAYIYFMLDFSSPIFQWEESKRKEESLRYTNLKASDVDRESVQQAMVKYEELQYEASRSLKSYKAVLKGLDAMDEYLDSVNFKQTDKQGKLLYTPNQFTANISSVNKAYDELAKLKRKIEEELSQGSSIRGSATMGDRELKYSTNALVKTESEFDETSPDEGGSIRFKDIDTILESN